MLPLLLNQTETEKMWWKKKEKGERKPSQRERTTKKEWPKADSKSFKEVA